MYVYVIVLIYLYCTNIPFKLYLIEYFHFLFYFLISSIKIKIHFNCIVKSESFHKKKLLVAIIDEVTQ